ncbi:MAG: hypothetical protein WC160_02310 [Bacilli bacterium]|jgi:Fe-S-cluster containining protein
MKKIKVSYSMLIQKFHSCTKNFILSSCKGECCCQLPNEKCFLVAIHSSETEKVKKLGGFIENNILKNKTSCQFLTKEGLCSIHLEKPFGCSISPFTLTDDDTLIIRDRYYNFKCFKIRKKRKYAYLAFKKSLENIFGPKNTKKLIDKVKKERKDFIFMISEDIYKKIKGNSAIRKKRISTL